MSPPADTPIAETEPGLPLPLVRRDQPRPSPRPAGRGGSRWRRGLGVLLVVGLAAAGVAAWLGRAPRPDAVAPAPLVLPAGPVAAPVPPGTVVGLGRLVPRGRIVVLAPPFGAGDARIAELRAVEGERVEAGMVLALLDSAPSLQAALAAAAAEATVAAREAALDQARVVTAAARDDARASLRRAEAAIVANRRDLDRALVLVGRAATTEQVLDQRRVTLAEAEAEAARARAALLRYDGPAEEQADIVLARRTLEAARAEAAQARANLERAVLRAPFAGSVLTPQARAGERIGEAGLGSFADLDDMIAEIEVYETHLRALAPGQPATILAAALPAPLAGRLSQIGAEILRQTLTDTSPAANTDSRVARVTAELDAASREVAARFPGLQVTARIATGAAP